MTTEEPRRYGVWAGMPQGFKENSSHCVEKVYSNDGFSINRQCSRKRGFGPHELHCKQHAKRYVTHVFCADCREVPSHLKEV